MDSQKARRFIVTGRVQGVGFRPTVAKVAGDLGLSGSVRNTGRGVEILVAGPSVDDFEVALRAGLPEVASIESWTVEPWSNGPSGDVEAGRIPGSPVFTIEESLRSGMGQPIPWDVSICPECIKDVLVRPGRRKGYPFTACAICGPRYTIIDDLPYDRESTRMVEFPLCPDCGAEYRDPRDRRFHAEATACPTCGPSLAFIQHPGAEVFPSRPSKDPLIVAADLLLSGGILGCKGLGGFHLMCDPCNPVAVARLRTMKERPRKPLAIMASDLDAASGIGDVDIDAERELTSFNAPIVLLHSTSYLLDDIAPGLDRIGVMLAYTPLHRLMLDLLPNGLVVATSANRKGEPIPVSEDGGLLPRCDGVLTHDRDIISPCDDSLVLPVGDGQRGVLRQGRGMAPVRLLLPPGLASLARDLSGVPAPYPVGDTTDSGGPLVGMGRVVTEDHTSLPDRTGGILAMGADMKGSVAVVDAVSVNTSQYLGDQACEANFSFRERTAARMLRLLHVDPRMVAVDAHPDSSGRGSPFSHGYQKVVPIQHHEAHLAGCMLENSVDIDEEVLGIVLDGFGYGSDGNAWGFEFLRGTYQRMDRVGHLEPIKYPGGDTVASDTTRSLALHLQRVLGEDAGPTLRRLGLTEVSGGLSISSFLEFAGSWKGLNTTSAGRLFDAVAAWTGAVRGAQEYEGRAPAVLEAMARRGENAASGLREWEMGFVNGRFQLDDLWAGLADSNDIAPKAQARLFHRSLATGLLDAVQSLGFDTFHLSGGVAFNGLLRHDLTRGCMERGMSMVTSRLISPGDEGVSAGQGVLTLCRGRD